MSEQAKSSLGVQILRGGEVFGEVHDVVIPGGTAEKKNTPSQNNIGGVMTKVLGWVDYDDLQFKIWYHGSSAQSTLFGDLADRTMETWMVVFPPGFLASGGRAFEFNGAISGMKPVANGNDPAEMEVTVAVNGRMVERTSIVTGLTTPFLSITNQANEALSLSPSAATAVYEYDVTAYSDDTGVKITATDATSGEVIYINGTLTATGVASSAITIGSASGSVVYIPVVIYRITYVPKVYWIRVEKGYSTSPSYGDR